MPVCKRDDCHTTSIIRDGPRISDITTDMAGIVFLTAVELASRSKCPRGAQEWCAGPGVEVGMNAAWQEREEARRGDAPAQNSTTATFERPGK